MATKLLSVLLLGPPEVIWDQKAVEFSTPLARALTFYLTYHAGMLRRAELAPFIENQQGQAPESLEGLCDQLDCVLPGFLRFSNDRIGVNPEFLSVDQWKFRDLLDQAGRLPWQTPAHLPLPDVAFRLLSQALALWRSPSFLDNLTIDGYPWLASWLENTSQKMERKHSRVAERLAEHAFVTNNPEQAIHLARVALVNDPFSENLNSLALRAFTACGRRDEALKFFHELEALLRRDLDTNPSPRLIEIYRSMQAGHATTNVSLPAPLWKLQPGFQAPYTGREQALGELHQVYEQGGGVLVVGESGQGKTRLLREFAERVTPRPRLLLASCHPAENNLSFQPLIDLLRHQVLLEEWLTLAPEWVAHLSLLLPELSALHPDFRLPAAGPVTNQAPDQMRIAIFEAIRQLFLRLASERRLLLCVDDCQWSDEATLAAIAYLLDRPPFDMRACLICTTQDDEKNAHLEILLPALLETNRLRFMKLERLDPRETGELVHQVTGVLPSERFIQLLDESTSGNPLFILETLHGRPVGEGQPVLDSPAPLPLAKSLRALINARIHQLSPAARRLIESAAILGADFDPDMLTELSTQASGLVTTALTELEQRSIIEPLRVDPLRLRYRFKQEIIREILVEQISPARQRRLHLAAAQLIEERLQGQTSDQAALLARHYAACGEIKRSFTFWTQAAQHALQLFSTADANQALSQAAALVPLLPGLADEEIYQLYADWNELVYPAEDAALLQQINAELLRLGQERNSQLLIGAALDGLSDVCLVANQYERGLDLAGQAILALEQSTNIDKQMEAYNHRGVFLYLLNRVEAAIESFQDALALGAGAEHPLVARARANSYYQIAVAWILSGFPKISRLNAHRAQTESALANRPHIQVATFNALALSQYFMGEYDEARRACEQGIELGERIHAWRMLGYLHASQAMIESSAGLIDRALGHITTAIRLGESYQHSEITAAGYRTLGDLLAWLERHDLAAIEYQRSLELNGDGFLAADAMVNLGLALYRTGQYEAGLSYQRQAAAVAGAGGQGLVLLHTKLAGLITEQLNGDWALVRAGLPALRSEASGRLIRAVQLTADLVDGEAALQAGDSTQAVRIFTETAIQASQLPQPWIALRALERVRAAQSHAGLNDPSIGEQITALLDAIEAGVTQQPYKDLFSNLRERLRS